MNEVLIYGGINTDSVSNIIDSINSVEGDELVVRMDTNGGDPQAAYGIAAKINEFEGKKVLKVDGRAISAGFLISCLVENVEALDVSEFMVHRAAYADWFEESEFLNDDLKLSLKRVNDDIKKAFIKKIDVESFEKIAKVTIDEIFSMDSRIDVYLTAKQAKKIGLIKKINKLTPEISASIDLKKFEAHGLYDFAPVNNKKEQPKVEKMTKEEFKMNHPEAYASVVAEGVAKKEAEIAAEKAAKEARKAEKEAIRAEVLAEIEASKENPGKALEIESAEEVQTNEVVSKEQTLIDEMSASIDSQLGLK